MQNHYGQKYKAMLKNIKDLNKSRDISFSWNKRVTSYRCEEGNGNPLQYSCLENSMHRGARRATVHEVTKESDWVTKQQTAII